MSKNNYLAIVTVLGVAVLLGTVSLNTVSVQAVKCEDIKYEDDPLKWGSESHSDNSPSEKKFYQALEEKTFCEVNKDIDHMKIKGEIKEDTKHDMDWLEQTIFYQSAGEESQDCIRDAYFNSPDSSGDDNAADYELLECTY